MSRYPTAKSIMRSLLTPFHDDLEKVNEFLEGRNDYLENAEKRGKASSELTRLADFIQHFTEYRKMKTKVFFGDETLGNAYIHEYDQIHLNKPNLLVGLHEIGHAIYGRSELDACIFSTSLILHTKLMKNQIPIFNNHKLMNLEYII